MYSFEGPSKSLFSGSWKLLPYIAKGRTSLDGSLSYQAFLDELVTAITSETNNFVVFFYQTMDT